MSQITRATLPAASPLGSTRNVSRSGRSTMSDSSIRTNPSIDEPSNMMSPSRAFSNWLSGTSTFLLTPRMSVNWSRRKETPCFLAVSRISRLVVMGEKAGEGGERRRRCCSPPPFLRLYPQFSLNVVVQEELIRMRPQRDRIDVLGALVADPRVDQVLRKYSPLGQEGVIGFERRQGLLQAPRRVLDVFALGRLQLVQVHVHWLGRLDLVLDAVETGHQQGCEGQIRVAGRIGRPELDALGLRRLRVHRDTADRRTVALRVHEVDRRLVARHQPAVAVRRRRRERED